MGDVLPLWLTLFQHSHPLEILQVYAAEEGDVRVTKTELAMVITTPSLQNTNQSDGQRMRVATRDECHILIQRQCRTWKECLNDLRARVVFPLSERFRRVSD